MQDPPAKGDAYRHACRLIAKGGAVDAAHVSQREFSCARGGNNTGRGRLTAVASVALTIVVGCASHTSEGKALHPHDPIQLFNVVSQPMRRRFSRV
jgi:hypothetical protein